MPSPIAHHAQIHADLFDALGAEYDALFPHKSGQIEAGRWLAERLWPGARVLDAGSGTGIPTAKMLAEAGFDVLGVDVSGEMVRLARGNVPGARFEQQDLGRLELEEHSFDAVTAFFSLLFLSRAQVETTLESFARSLRPGGHLVVSMVDGDCDALDLSFRGMPARWTACPQAEFERMLGRAGFELLRSEAMDFMPPSPDLHPERQLFFYCRRPT